MATQKGKILEKAFELLETNPDGLHYSKLIKEISAMLNVKEATVNGAIWSPEFKQSSKIYKPSRGLYRLTKFNQGGAAPPQLAPVVLKSNLAMAVKEENFYKPFADWLVNELEDCTKAVPVGGNKFGDKWATPDVVGKNEAKPTDIFRPPAEIVSAEIKTDVNQLITAFGQTCSYRLFSHKVYLVIPKTSPQEDIDRLDSLCMVFGIGLILFNPTDVENPDWYTQLRAIKHDPDMYYMNKYMKFLEKELFI
jgi:hypothetical protein